MIAINAALQVDLTGQASSDSIGARIFADLGGKMDFLYNSAKSEGGKPIIALSSCNENGESNILTTLPEGTGIITTRAHIHYVCTEYGIAELYGKNLFERAKAMIRIGKLMSQTMK